MSDQQPVLPSGLTQPGDAPRSAPQARPGADFDQTVTVVNEDGGVVTSVSGALVCTSSVEVVHADGTVS